jgi:NADH-quinone oxidoreductase subunit N
MNLHPISSELLLTCAGFLLLLLQAFAPSWKRLWAPATVVAFLGALGLLLRKPGGLSFFDTYEVSALTFYFQALFLLGGAFAALLGSAVLRRDGVERAEHYTFLLWGTVGMMLMVSSRNWILAFIGLEILSVALYVLTAFYRDTAVAVEAALKYFLLGSFASAITLFGMAYYFGLTSTLAIGVGIQPLPRLYLVAVVLLAAGFAFKMALVPLHAWAPDVYQGSPSSVTLWLATLPKMAALVLFLRVLQPVAPSLTQGVLGTVAVLTMVAGNFLALVQDDVKRMLAFSGVAHMGYILIGVTAFTPESLRAVFFYAAAYAVTALTAFAVLGLISRGEQEPHFLSDFAGLGFTHPVPAFVLTLCLASLAGIPPLVGFAGKFFLFYSAVAAGQMTLAVLGILNSILSVYYYIRVIYTLYMREPGREPVTPARSLSTTAGLILLGFLILLLGLLPGGLDEASSKAAGAFWGLYVQ